MGVFHIRRQIPEALRPAFGGRQLHKKTLGAKDPKQATALFPKANAELEGQFELARARLAATGSLLSSARDHATTIVHAYFNGLEKAPGGLDGPGRLLLGLWNGALLSDRSRGCTTVAPSTTDEWADLARHSPHPSTCLPGFALFTLKAVGPIGSLPIACDQDTPLEAAMRSRHRSNVPTRF